MLLQIFNFFFKLVDQTYSFFLCFQNPFSYLHGADLLQPLCSDGLRVFSSPFGWAGWWGSEFSGGVRKKKQGEEKAFLKLRWLRGGLLPCWPPSLLDSAPLSPGASAEVGGRLLGVGLIELWAPRSRPGTGFVLGTLWLSEALSPR